MMQGDGMSHGAPFAIRGNHRYSVPAMEFSIQRPEPFSVNAVIVG
jgi:hypothetical protein